MATSFVADFENDPSGLVYDTVFRVYLDHLHQSKAINGEVYKKAQEEREILRRYKQEEASSRSQDQLQQSDLLARTLNPQKPIMSQTFLVPVKKSETAATGLSKSLGQTGELKEGGSISRPTGQQSKQHKDGKGVKEVTGGQKANLDVKPGKDQVEGTSRPPTEDEIHRMVEEAVHLAEMNLMEQMQKQAREVHTYYTRVEEKKDEEIRKITDYNDRAKLEIEDLKSRLSRLSAEKLKAGNPNIGDLSDPFRPSELGRKFGEIYDNEWSDAFEKVQKFKIGDRENAALLYQIVMDSYHYCESIVELQCVYIRNLLISPYGQQKDEASKTFMQTLGQGDRQRTRHELIIALKDSRKKYARETAKNVAKVYVKEQLHEKLVEFKIPKEKLPEELETYAEKCANMSWHMVICDPPVIMVGCEVDAPFDDAMYKEFQTKATKPKEFVVSRSIWPALRLGHGGAMLEKGVVEPVQKKT